MADRGGRSSRRHRAHALGLAVIAPDAADAVSEAHPEIERWVIGGHSLGGAMAAGYAAGHDTIDGLALWAVYPADGTDLIDSDLAVTSVYATEDGLATISRAQQQAQTVAATLELIEAVDSR